MADVHPTAVVYPGTVLGEGVSVLEGAVVGKQPTLSPRSTAKREQLPPATLGAGGGGKAGATAAGDAGRRHDRLDGRDRLRGNDDRRSRDPRRPVVRARA